METIATLKERIESVSSKTADKIFEYLSSSTQVALSKNSNGVFFDINTLSLDELNQLQRIISEENRFQMKHSRHAAGLNTQLPSRLSGIDENCQAQHYSTRASYQPAINAKNLSQSVKDRITSLTSSLQEDASKKIDHNNRYYLCIKKYAKKTPNTDKFGTGLLEKETF